MPGETQMRSQRVVSFGFFGVVLGVVLLLGPTAAVADYVVGSGHGVTFVQMDQTFPGFTEMDSDWAWVDVDVSTLAADSGMSSGFLNVWQVGHGWSVQNMQIDPALGEPTISTLFGLPVFPGTDVSSLQAYVLYSSLPITSLTPGTADTFAVGAASYNAEGEGAPTGAGLGPAPSAAAVAFVNSAWQMFTNATVGNIETADNQCGPSAAANSLYWLSNRYRWIQLKHKFIPGVYGAPANSLPAVLDLAYDRHAGNAIGGDDMVEGIMRYLQNAGLQNDVTVKYQGTFSASVTTGGQTVNSSGAVPTAAWIKDEVEAEEDVEICMFFPGGGAHWVKVKSVATVGGRLQVTYIDDGNQGAAGGLRSTTRTLVDNDADGTLEFAGTNIEIRKVVSESPVVKRRVYANADPSDWARWFGLVLLGAMIVVAGQRRASASTVAA
jgi:hypothetical protein